MILHCKMCGGSLEMLNKSSVYKCQYCGTEQTVPQIDDEQILGMLDRANHFRQVFEFDKAIEIYERIIENGTSDADIYWALVLCRYGIEYVDDPITKEKIPTCHRMQYKFILEDADYLMALNKADSLQRVLFEKEANYIYKVQKSILEISNKEKPFDVFICYKESDEKGRRTVDSVLAQDIYYQLTEKKYKVFFSRITLESKLGQQYEPYIFAALNSAKVMIVLGTKPEYYNAVWVKNEWNRFLDIMRNDKSRLIIPAYKDFDPYELPDELSYFQALDMSKIGFIQDLVRGIDKVLGKTSDYEKEIIQTSAITEGAANNVAALLKRGELALEDMEWEKAYDFYDKVLNLDAENGFAYLGQALSKMKAKSLEIVMDKRIYNFECNLRKIISEEIQVGDESKFEELTELIQKNKILLRNDFILPKYVKTIESGVNSIKKLIFEEESWFSTNKLLTKAARFSEKIEKDIQETEQAIFKRMYSEMATMQSLENERRNEALIENDKYYEEFREKMVNIIDQRKNEYEILKKQCRSGNYSNCNGNGLKTLQSKLRIFLGYQDAEMIWNEITARIKRNDTELQQLHEREREILYHEFLEIKGPRERKKQRQEILQQELKDIQRKIQDLNDEL